MLRYIQGMQREAERSSLSAYVIHPDSLPSEATNKMDGTEEERLHGLHEAAFEKEHTATTKAVFLKKPMADKHGFDRIPREIEQKNQKENHLMEDLDNKYGEDLDGLLGVGVENGKLADEMENINIGKVIQYTLSEGDRENIKIGKNHLRKRRRGGRAKVPLEVVI